MKLDKITFLILSLLFISFVACFYSTISWMYGRFMSADSYYSHGFIIPFVSGFFIWQERDILKKTNIETSWLGLILICIALLTHILSTIIYVFSMSGFAIFLLFLGSILFLFGKDIFKIIMFPLCFLIFMFPLPQAVINVISFPMKMIVAKVGVELVSLLGIPIFREGFNITIPSGSLLVGNPCSGLRSLIAFLALGSILAYLSHTIAVRKVILFLLAIPIAILSNIIRVPILILISHFWSLETASPGSFWHDASGVFVFIIGIILLFYTGKFMEWKILEKNI